LDDAALYLCAHTRLAAGEDTTAPVQEAREQRDVLVVDIFGANIATDAATTATLFALNIFGRAFDNGAVITLFFITLFSVIVAVEVIIFFV
jgi:hypothetical protein